MSCSKGSSKRDVYGNTGLIQTTQIQINNLAYPLKESDKEEQTKANVNKRKGMIKIREETNKTKINKNNKKDQWHQELLFKNINKTDTLLSRFTNEREDTNRQNKKLKRRNNNWYHRDMKNT